MKKMVSVIACAAVLVAVGCSQENPSSPTANSETTAAVDGSQYLLAAEPAGAADVIKLRQDVQSGDEVVMVGRIGGSLDPWVDGWAAFTIVDQSLKACSDIPGDACSKPWDYCCETEKLPSSTALVRIVDDQGQTIQADAKQLLNVQELSTVVIQGKAKRDESGNLMVLASGVFVKQK